MLRIFSIGSATVDIFVRSSEAKVIAHEAFRTGRAIAVPLEEKIVAEQMHVAVGGGAINTATTFARQGFRVFPVATIGDDMFGREVLSVCRREKMQGRFLRVTPGATGASLILTAGEEGRTIVAASGVKWETDVPWNKLSAGSWLYLNHLGGSAASLVPKILRTARRNRLRTAWNPGATQLEQPQKLRTLLKHVDILLVNGEEASRIAGVSYGDARVFSVLDKLVAGLVVMTKGPQGVEVSDGKTVWSAGILAKGRVADRTGAGDAFGAAFVASLLRSPKDVPAAIQLASANATGVVGVWGATEGALRKKDSPLQWGRLKIMRRSL